MEDDSSSIDTAYNAGNVTGAGNTGGIAGAVAGGKITNAYNGDNNTVIREQLGTVPEDVKKAEETITKDGKTYTFKYDQQGDGAICTYYSFYTVDNDVKTYYYFLSEGGSTSSGCNGIYVDKTGAQVSLPAAGTRYYLNRVGYKDANITGTTNVGGIVGNFVKGTAAAVYNVGSVSTTDSTAATTGALAGTKTADASIQGFFVTGDDASIKKEYSKAANAVGTNATAGMDNMQGLTILHARAQGELHNNFAEIFVGQNSNQNATWLTYQEQTLPLLKYFMNTMDIERVFQYDGTIHNLKTDDVNDLYGRSDFEIGTGAGQNVHTEKEGITDSDQYLGSSKYNYDNSSLWSPQHGFKTDVDAAVVITPAKLQITLSGNKTYGDINNLTGYYICVPYNGRYAFYTVSNVGGNYTYTKVTNEQEFFGTDGVHTKEDLQALADSEAKYVVTMNGIIASEATNLDAVVSGVVTALNNGSAGDAFQGNIWGNENNEIDDQQLDAGDYGFDNEKGVGLLSGVKAQHRNYNIAYNGALKIKQADLYYTYDGERVYGHENSEGTHKFTLVGTDDKSNTSSVHGFLKDWDEDMLKLLGYSFENGKYVITDENVIDGSSKYTLLGHTQDNESIRKYITPDGKVGNDTSNFKDVLRDAAGGEISSYTVTELKDVELQFKDANADALNKNYKLTWKEGGEQQGFVTSQQVVAGEDTPAFVTTYHNVTNSTQKITPASLTVTQSGEREYGRDNSTAKYGDVAVKDGGLLPWDKTTFAGIVPVKDASQITNQAERQTAVGDNYKNYFEVALGDNAEAQEILKNYDVTSDTDFTITSADFTYIADHTEYWQGQFIPPQSGVVINKWGEDVTDLVGTIDWQTTADRLQPGTYPIVGVGSNDKNDNYEAHQSLTPGAQNNDLALLIKPHPNDMHTDAVQAFGLTRRPLLDLRYLTVAGTAGLNRWVADEEAGFGVTVLYDRDKLEKYRF